MSRRLQSALWAAFAIVLFVGAFLVVLKLIVRNHEAYVQQRVCEALLSQLEQALSLYRMDYDEYPPPAAGGLALLGTGSARHGAYFEFKESQRDKSGRILDPWGHPFVYRIHRREGSLNGKIANLDRFEIYATGPNGIDEGYKGDDINLK